MHATGWSGNQLDFLHFLKRCPNLIDLLLAWVFIDTETLPSGGMVIKLPHLRRLMLEDFHEDHIQRVLPHIHAHSDAVLCIRALNTETDEHLLSWQDVSSMSCTRLELLVHAQTAGKGYLTCSVAALGQTSGLYVDSLFSLSHHCEAPGHSELV